MAREIKFSLVYRDMWQSSGKYVPRVDQLEEVAPAIIDMGCFDRVETNGGAFEQVNLLFGDYLVHYTHIIFNGMDRRMSDGERNLGNHLGFFRVFY